MSLKVLIFLISLPIIYRQLEGKYPDYGLVGVLEILLSGFGIWFFAAATLLMLVNWSLEAAKWSALLAVIQPLKHSDALGAILTGVYISLFTPNRAGEFLGRIIYLTNRQKIAGTMLSFCGSLAQISITIIGGTVGLSAYFLYTGDTIPMVTIAVLGLLASGFALFMYFNFQEVIRPFLKLKWLKRYAASIDAIDEVPIDVRRNVWLLSLARYAVFTLQYILLLYAFDVSVPFHLALAGVMSAFFGNFSIPSMTLTELGVRGVTALFFIGTFSDNTMGIAMATYSLWVINILVPALAGGLKVLIARYDDGHLV